MPDITIDTSQAAKFLSTLDPNAESFCFQHIHDTLDRADSALHLSLDQLDDLKQRNLNGYGTFVTTNHVINDQRRTWNNVDVIRVICADDDVPKDEPRTDWPITPSIIVESSKGKYHYYWLVHNNGTVMTTHHSEGLKRLIAKSYDTDFKGVAGPNRVLRVPGFIHSKNKPFRSKLIYAKPIKYTVQELDDAFNFHHTEPDQTDLHKDINDKHDHFVHTLNILRDIGNGEYHVQCPWYKNHSNVSDDRANFMLAGTGGYPYAQFHCHHDSCDGKSINDIIILNAMDYINSLPVAFEFKAALPKVDVKVTIFRNMAEVLADEREPEWLIEDLIERDTVNILYGDTGTFKSFLAIEVSMCVASGNNFQDKYVERGGAFYIASEGQAGINRRIRAHNKRFNYKVGDHLWPSNFPAKLGDEKYMNIMADEIINLSKQSDTPPNLITIDTLAASSAGLNTDSNDDMSAMIEMCNDLRRRIGGGVSFLIIHHTGHDKGRLRGASALKANVDSSIRIDFDNGIVKLTVEKLKDGDTSTELFFVPKLIVLGKHTKTGKDYGSMILERGDVTPGEALASTMGLKGNKLIAFNILYDLKEARDDKGSVNVARWRLLVQQTFAASGEYKDEKNANNSANRCITELCDSELIKVYKNKAKIVQ